MKEAKKAKGPKKVKEPKLPKEPIKKKLTKEEKKLVKKTKKDLIKSAKLLNKKVNRMIGLLGVVLCLISSVLDVLIIENKKKAQNNK